MNPINSISKLRVSRSCRQQPLRSGFTLVEMIVATMLLVIGVAAAQTVIASAARASGIADKINTATLLLQKKCTDLELNSNSISGGGGSGGFGVEYPGFSWHQTSDATNYNNLFKVTITVQWGDGTAASQRSITTYLRGDQNTINQNIIKPPTTNSTATSGSSGGI